MTPPRSEQARELVDHFGSRRAAARAVGIDESTLRYWLDPESKRSRVRERYWSQSGYERNRLLLRQRRWAALKRREQRLNKEGLDG